MMKLFKFLRNELRVCMFHLSLFYRWHDVPICPYDEEQIKWIVRGIRSGVEYKSYWNPYVFTAGQMKWICKGFEKGLNVSIYYLPGSFPADKMKWLYKGLVHGLPMGIISGPERYDSRQLFFIYHGLRNGFDISPYLMHPAPRWDKMLWIHWAKVDGYNTTYMERPHITAQKAKLMYITCRDNRVKPATNFFGFYKLEDCNFITAV